MSSPVQEIWTMRRFMMKKTEEEEIMIIGDENNSINDDHEDKEEDDSITAQVTSIFHPILAEYITKYALFHICRKCFLNSDIFWNMLIFII